MKSRLPCFVALGIMTFVQSAAAQSPVATELVEQLDADTFGERHAATRTLRRLGQRAHAALAEAARSGSAESRTRALEILESHLQTNDPELHNSAKTTLEQLSQGDSTAARLAQTILAPPQPTSNDWIRLAQLRGIQIARPRLGIPLGARPQLPAAVRRYSLTINENGRTIRIRGSEKGIQIEVSETKKDGRKTVNRYSAKNAAELKANHPEAHAIFQDMRQRYGLRDPNP